MDSEAVSVPWIQCSLCGGPALREYGMCECKLCGFRFVSFDPVHREATLYAASTLARTSDRMALIMTSVLPDKMDFFDRILSN